RVVGEQLAEPGECGSFGHGTSDARRCPGRGRDPGFPKRLSQRAAILVVVAGPVTPDAAARDSQRRTATRYALTAVVLAGIGAMLMALDLATRPPCYPGYVRLIDVELLGAIVVLALVTISIVVY